MNKHLPECKEFCQAFLGNKIMNGDAGWEVTT